jgi:wobble nucleotide-excising tRNase
MIDSILLKNIASYDQNGVEISDLKRLNFFFGSNGSGKSTIAKYLDSLCQEDSESSNQFLDCSNNGFDHSNHDILVYDENFVEVNFNQNHLLKGVFSLNETNEIIDREIRENQAKIDVLTSEKERRKTFKVTLEQDKANKKNTLLNYCWGKRNIFSSFLKLSLQYPGSRPNHFGKLKQTLQSNPTDSPTIEEITNKYNLYFEKEITEIEISIDAKLYREIRELELKLKPLLNKVIVGNEDVDIDSLIKSLESRSWVELGLKYLDKVENTCPFCQKETIDDSLRNQFSQYFDETSKLEVQTIETLLTSYKTKTNEFLANISQIQASHNPNNTLSNLYINLKRLFDANIQELENKILHSNERKNITSLSTFKEPLSNVISSINANNKALTELDQNKEEVVSSIWVYMALECKEEIENFELREEKYQRLNDLTDNFISNYDSKLVITRQEIERLRSQTVNTQDAVDNINLILKNSGFESFEIKERDNVNNISQYYLKRPNIDNESPIFKSLSEGEKSFISFLYFFQLCIGTDNLDNNASKKKIIVIDDPVSSLDSQSLFVISSLIHKLILRKSNDNRPNRMLFKNDNIEQVFILTHNLYFYKEVSFDRRPLCTSYWHYKVSKINNVTAVQGQRNKVITDDYTLLWNNIKEIKHNLPENTELNILIANSMRRIIESYVNFLGIGKDAWSAILTEDTESPEFYLKYAFVASINDESHGVTVLDSVYYQKISTEQPELLFDVFKEIFSNLGREHYELMMEEQFEE